jgi:uncharacterized Ntn-hydrolase superfamily protein
MAPPRFGTFSIVAADPGAGTWGVAVQSKFISVGAVVPYAEAGVGAIATQADANAEYGPKGLELLRQGKSARAVVQELTDADPGRDTRQLGVVDAHGGAAAYTGAKCMDWAGHQVGDGFTCQGNILFGPGVVKAMARTYEATPGDLVDRLLAALATGQREGGDRRGQQAAALLVVRKDGGDGHRNDRWIDVRVDDHPSPIEELRRVFRLYDLTMLEREDPASLVEIRGDVALAIQHDLGVLGYYPGRSTGTWDASSRTSFTKFLHEHNFENKERDDDRVWPSILGYLKERASVETARRTTTAPIVPGALDRGPGAQRPAGGASSPRPAKKKPTSK